MDYITSFIMIALAATIHASFQLSISTLTLMSGHSLGTQQSHQKLVSLVFYRLYYGQLHVQRLL